MRPNVQSIIFPSENPIRYIFNRLHYNNYCMMSDGVYHKSTHYYQLLINVRLHVFNKSYF